MSNSILLHILRRYNIIKNPKTYDTESWLKYLNARISLIYGKALENIKKAQEHQKKFYYKKAKIKYDYQVGDLITRKNLEKSTFPKERWSGPWVIVKKNNAEGTAYTIKKQGDSSNYLSTANARHMRKWYQGINDEDLNAMATSSRGEDGVKDTLWPDI
ncbi:hypothetical protein INT48_003020 [Thamnidium elegans]|uniref:Uncharacterized protein n=1 Tax=Thamnidium elegans TaxID=101142 RepID=A0A8H7SLS9_9FUNG|nr:hypothetical protein INT48_003020 [Thamnidium elegans]